MESDYVVIYSHGNSPDMGIMLDTYLDMCYNLGINVVAYDYFGYGQSFSERDDFAMIQ
jgi:predicted oxidoreductase